MTEPAQPSATWRAIAGPTAAVLIVMAVSLTTYHHLWKFVGPAVHRPIATVAGLIAFGAIGFGPLVLYPIGRARGVALRTIVAACLVTPVVWNVKEIVRVTTYFTVPEAVYYGLNTAFLLALFGALGQMGLCELVYRWRRGTGAPSGRVVTPGPVLCIGLAVAAFFALLVWGGGVHAFYIYIEGYRALFT